MSKEINRKDAVLFLLTRLTDIIAGNDIEELNIDTTLPFIIHNIKKNEHITQKEYDDYKKIQTMLKNTIEVMSKEMFYFYNRGKTKKNAIEYIKKMAKGRKIKNINDKKIIIEGY